MPSRWDYVNAHDFFNSLRPEGTDISSLHGLKSTGLHTPVKDMFPYQLLAIPFPLPSQLTTRIRQEFDRSMTGIKSFQTPHRLSAKSLRELERKGVSVGIRVRRERLESD